MMGNMSVVFLLLGIILSIIIFYAKGKEIKIFLGIPILLLMASFFVGTFSMLNYNINVLIVLGNIGILFYFLKKSRILNFSIFSILLTIIYIFILNLDNLYLTSFNYYPILLIGTLFNILFSQNQNEIIANAVGSSICFETINFIYFQNFFGYASVFDFSFLNFAIYYILSGLLSNWGLVFIKKIFMRRKSQCVPLKSQF